MDESFKFIKTSNKHNSIQPNDSHQKISSVKYNDIHQEINRVCVCLCICKCDGKKGESLRDGSTKRANALVQDWKRV